MGFRLSACAGAALLALGVQAAVAQTARVSDNAVRIGVLTDLSSVSSENAGAGSVLAAKMAVEDFAKDGKVLGVPIEVISADHQGKTDIGANIAREWFDRRGIDMVTDLTFSNVALAVMKIADEKKRLTLVTGAGAGAITNEQCNASTVHWMYDTYSLSVGTASALLKQGKRDWYFITADYAFGHALEKDASAYVSQNGGRVVGAVKHPINPGDFASYLLQAKSSKAQVVALANAGIDTLNTVKQAAEFGMIGEGAQVFAPLLSLITEIHAMGLQNAQGLLLTDGFYWNQDAQARQWSERFYATHKKMPTMMQAAVYSAVLHYLRAIQASGTDDSTVVMAKMRATEVNDPIIRKGKIRADGRLVHDMQLVQVKKPGESTHPWDLYKIVQQIPGDQAFLPLAQSRCPLVKKPS